MSSLVCRPGTQRRPCDMYEGHAPSEVEQYGKYGWWTGSSDVGAGMHQPEHTRRDLRFDPPIVNNRKSTANHVAMSLRSSRETARDVFQRCPVVDCQTASDCSCPVHDGSSFDGKSSTRLVSLLRSARLHPSKSHQACFDSGRDSSMSLSGIGHLRWMSLGRDEHTS
jgi:hypothetical protein